MKKTYYIIETDYKAVLKNKKKFKGNKIGLILTGGNVDVNNLPF